MAITKNILPFETFYFAILWLSLIFCGPGVSTAFAIEDNCPHFFATPIADFQKLFGHWHIHTRIKNTPGFTSIKCLHLHWTSENLMEEPWQLDEIVHLTSIDTNTTATEYHTAYIRNSLAPARWSVFEREVHYNITMLYTNYEYSMWAQCSVQNNERVLQIFFASRHVDEPFPQILKSQLLQILGEDYGIDVNLIYNVPQGSEICPEESEQTTKQSSTPKGKGSTIAFQFSTLFIVTCSSYLLKQLFCR